jgi:hypothetical protein
MTLPTITAYVLSKCRTILIASGRTFVMIITGVQDRNLPTHESDYFQHSGRISLGSMLDD